MKKWLTVIICMLAVAGYAQTYKVQKAWAFVTESVPGMIMKDENGNDVPPVPMVERFIYIESSSKTAPVISSITCNGKPYQWTVLPVKETKHLAGMVYKSGKPFYIIPKKGHTLWRISLTATTEAVLRSGAVKIITIKGKPGAGSFKQTLYTETRLNGPEYQ